MGEGLVPFGSPFYFAALSALIFARAMDFLSTWIATPNLVLEANPIARKLGWRGGVLANFFLCLGFAVLPLPIFSLRRVLVLGTHGCYHRDGQRFGRGTQFSTRLVDALERRRELSRLVFGTTWGDASEPVSLLPDRPNRPHGPRGRRADSV